MDDTATQQVDPYADITIDQLLSMYAIAYKDGKVELFTEYRNEILKRVRAIDEIKYKLNNISL